MVIAVIGLLATIVTVSVNSARKKGRDAKRLVDIKSLQTALDLYYDKYGSFSLSGQCGATIPNTGWSNSVQCLSGGRWLRDATSNLSEFLPQDPLDPKQGSSANWLPTDGGTYFYYSRSYGGDGQWYMIIFGLENYPHPMEQQDGVRAPNGTYFHYGSGSNGIITVGRNNVN